MKPTKFDLMRKNRKKHAASRERWRLYEAHQQILKEALEAGWDRDSKIPEQEPPPRRWWQPVVRLLKPAET